MHIRPPFAPLIGIGIGIVIAACGGSSGSPSGPSGPSAPAIASYSGLFSLGTQTGTLSLVAGSPATGSLKILGAALVPLSGTFNPTAGTFVLTGGGYSLSASIDAQKQITGTLTGASGMAPGVVTAMGVTSGANSTTYCGVFSGNATGKLHAVIMGSNALGLAVQDGMPSPENTIPLTGSVTGSTITLGWKLLITPGVYGTGTATGTVSGQAITGTWSNTAGEKGGWTAASTGC